MEKKIQLFTVTVLILALFTECISAWGVKGHAIVASVAAKLMTAKSTAAVQSVLTAGGDTDMISIASWADQVRYSSYPWSAPYHFINTADWACTFVPATDCSAQTCVAAAIVNYTSQILSTDVTTSDEAVKFVTHFFGDIHQPLHVSFASDYGGNSIKPITFEGDSTWNLHSVWDDAIINQRISANFTTQDNYISYLLSQLAAEPAITKQWTQCLTSVSALADCTTEWGVESAALACQYAYTNVDGTHIASNDDLEDPYYNFATPIVDQQLAKAGLRLAALYNLIWA